MRQLISTEFKFTYIPSDFFVLQRQTTSAEGPGQEAKRPISGLPGDPVMSLDPQFPEVNLTETVIHIISTSQIRVKGKRRKLGDF